VEIKRILIVDDHPVVRMGLKRLIDQDKSLKICGEAADAEQAIASIKTNPPHLVITDLSLQSVSGLELIKQIRKEYEKLPILMFSVHEESFYAERALQAGAQGYLLKSESPDKILPAIHKILEGDMTLSDTMVNKVLRRFGGSSGTRISDIDALTEREFEIYRLIGLGESMRSIADKLRVSVKTVEAHRENIKRKLAVAKASELSQKAALWVRFHDGDESATDSPVNR